MTKELIGALINLPLKDGYFNVWPSPTHPHPRPPTQESIQSKRTLAVKGVHERPDGLYDSNLSITSITSTPHPHPHPTPTPTPPHHPPPPPHHTTPPPPHHTTLPSSNPSPVYVAQTTPSTLHHWWFGTWRTQLHHSLTELRPSRTNPSNCIYQPYTLPASTLPQSQMKRSSCSYSWNVLYPWPAWTHMDLTWTSFEVK